MKLLQFVFIFTVLVASCVSAFPQYSAPRRNYRDGRAGWHLRPRGIFSCKEEGESCRGVPKCCGDLVCYWENGYSVRTPGVCVTCINDGQICQRDAQCCSDLICHKASMYDVNGECGAKLPVGAECHDNDQCETEYCNMEWYEDVQGHGGRCDQRP